MFDLPWARPAHSTTPRQLRRLRLASLVATVLVGLALGGVVLGGHGSVRTVADRTAPAATAVQVARASLAEANHAVVESFRSGTARLAGPGQRYQDGITRANRSLAQLGEHYARDLTATQQLQFINAMLVTYMGLVAQADTAHRLAGATGADYDLGLIYLWHASKLLFDPEGGILSLIDAVGEPVAADLSGQADAWPLRPGALAVLLPVVAVLLGLLLVTQAFLVRRFRRLLNPPLALATLALVVVSLWTALATLDTGDDYQAALAAHTELTGQWRQQAAAAGQESYAGLRELLAGPCEDEPACDAAVAAALTRAAPPGAAPPEPGTPAPGTSAPAVNPLDSGAQIRFSAAMAEAAPPAGLRIGVPAAAVLIGALILLGFKARLDEFHE